MLFRINNQVSAKDFSPEEISRIAPEFQSTISCSGNLGGISLDESSDPLVSMQLNDGDTPISWLQFLLQIYGRISELQLEDGQSTAILHRSENQIYLLDNREFCAEISSKHWKSRFESIIIWGIQDSSFRRLKYPVPCRGCLFSLSESHAIGWKCSSSDLSHLELPKN